MRFHENVLGVGQRRVLADLGHWLTEQGFYLAGGTALALQLGHRRSVDLDWFSPRLDEPSKLAIEIAQCGRTWKVLTLAENTLHGSYSGIRVSFLKYRYLLLQPLLKWRKYDCHLASPADLGAMKLSAVIQRGSKKDFLDLFALARRRPLAQIVKDYQNRFGIHDLGHVYCSLVYFDDADQERTPPSFLPFTWRSIKNWFREKVQMMVA